MPVRITTLGGLRAERDGVELDNLLLQRVRAALLVYLAVEKRVGRDVLTAAFWPESDESDARHALRQSLYHLRRTVGEACIETLAQDVRVTDSVRTDVEAFEAAIARGDPAAAARLYAGPFLNGVHLADLQAWESWVDARRTRYARAFRKACRDWLEERRAAGDAAGAVEAAQCWVAPDPTDDEAEHRLIEALADAGERAEAIRQYEAYARMLEADGLKPLDETVALVESLRAEPRAPIPPVRQPPADTAPAAGERISPPLAERGDVPDTPPAGLPEGHSRPRRSRLRVAVAVVGTAAVVLLASVLMDGRNGPPPSTAVGVARLAVLPFQNETGSADLDWLARGITQDLADALHAASRLDVTAPSGVRVYREGAALLPDVARDLSADWLIAGNVARRGDRVVVRTELIDPAGRLVDSREVEGDTAAALRIVDDVVIEVAGFLRSRIGEEVRVRDWSAETRSETAFRLLYAAFRDIDAADRLAEEDDPGAARRLLGAADSALVLAADADRRWTAPHVARAMVRRKLGLLAGRAGEPVEDVGSHFADGIEQAEEALRRAPGNAAALEARGVLRHTLWLQARPADSLDAARLLAAAEEDLRSATAADPGRAKAWSALSSIRFASSEYALAHESARRAYEADAYLEEAPEILARLFTIAFESADDADAAPWCAELRRRFPDFWFGTSCRLSLQAWAADSAALPDEVWREMNQTIDRTPQEYRPAVRAQLEMQVAGVLVRAGMSDSAGRVLDRARARAFADTTFTRYPINAIELLPYEAEVRGSLGQVDSAARLMTRYFTARPDYRARFLSSRRFRVLVGAGVW